MFEVGTYVLYGTTGVCRIAQIRRESFSGETKEYYILTPVDNPGMTIYVPTDAELLMAQMKHLLSRGEMETLIRAIPQVDTVEWIDDPRTRNEMFRQILQSGDRRRLLQLLKTIRCRRQEQAALGRKLYLADETVFQKAEHLLYGEIATILQIRPEEVQNFIRSQLPAEG